VQVDEQLPVAEPSGEPVRGVHGQGGLADPGHPVDRGDHHRARVSRTVGRLGKLQQTRQFGLPAGEHAGVSRQPARHTSRRAVTGRRGDDRRLGGHQIRVGG